MRIPTLHVGQGAHFGGLSVFPVWTDGPRVRGLDTGTRPGSTWPSGRAPRWSASWS